jgi:trehalose 6-phosphate phosphatase
VGNHGLEGLPVEASLYLRAQKTCAGWAKKIIRLLAQEKIEDVLLENKLYSLSLHYRRSKRPEQTRRDLLALAERLSPQGRILPGKFVVNLIPPQLPNKGDAVKTLLAIEDCDAAIYVGDDDTDEDVFRLRLPNLLSVSVGRRRSSSADFYVRDQTEVQRLLLTLLRLRKVRGLR